MLKYLFILFCLPMIIHSGTDEIAKRDASRYNDASAAFEAHYHTKPAINRRASFLSGAGFWQAVVENGTTGDKHRLMFLAKEEYIPPHSHDLSETFNVISGSCKIWTQSSVRGNKWNLLVANTTTPISIPAGMLYCVLATNDLCMHQVLDRTPVAKPWTFERKPNLPFKLVEKKAKKK